MTDKKSEQSAVWRAANPEGYAVGDLAGFMGEEFAKGRAQRLQKQKQEIIIAREGETRIVWDGKGIREVNNGVAAYISYYAVLEAFCGSHSAAPEGERTLNDLIPFLKKATPTSCPVTQDDRTSDEI